MEHPSPQEPSDQELIQRAQAGDDRAFQKIYRRHAPAMLRRLHRLTNDASLAEDGLQRVFLEAHRSLANYRGEGSLAGWLHRITERIAIRLFETQWRSRTIRQRLGFHNETLQMQHKNQEKALIQKEIQEWMHTFIERLPPSQRGVLLLCDLEGKQTDEVAQTLDIPRGTVASRLHHARKKVRQMIERELKRQGLSWGDVIDASETH